MRNEAIVHCDTEDQWKNLIKDFYEEGRKFTARRHDLTIIVKEKEVK